MPALIQKTVFEHPDGMARVSCNVYLQTDGRYHTEVLVPTLERVGDSDEVLMTEPQSFSGASVDEVLAQVRARLARDWKVEMEFVQPTPG